MPYETQEKKTSRHYIFNKSLRKKFLRNSEKTEKNYKYPQKEKTEKEKHQIWEKKCVWCVYAMTKRQS